MVKRRGGGGAEAEAAGTATGEPGAAQRKTPRLSAASAKEMRMIVQPRLVIGLPSQPLRCRPSGLSSLLRCRPDLTQQPVRPKDREAGNRSYHAKSVSALHNQSVISLNILLINELVLE